MTAAEENGRTRVRRKKKKPGRRKLPVRRRTVLVILLLVAVTAGIVFLLRRPGDSERLESLRWRAGQEVSAGRFAIAKKMLEDYRRERPGDPRGRFLLGVARLGLEEEEGLSDVEAAVRDQPRLIGARLFLARCYAKRGRLREALEAAAAAEEAEAALVEARLLTRLGRLEEASGAYGKAMVRGADDLGTRLEALELHLLLAGRGHRGASAHRERALQLTHQVQSQARTRLERISGDPQALAATARVEEILSPDAPARIEAAWAAALDADPASLPMRARFASSLRKQGKTEEARKLLAEAVETAGDPGPFLVLADHHGAVGKPDQAVTVLSQAVERWPLLPALRATWADALLTAGRPEEAGSVLTEALDLNPDHPGLLEAAGDLAVANQDPAGAAELYERAFELRPGRAEILKKRIRLFLPALAAAGAKGGDLPEELRRARDLLDRLSRLVPGDRDSLRWEAELARARGREDRALSLLNELLALHPDDVEGRAMRGRLLHSRQDWVEAASEFSTIIGSADATLEEFQLYAQSAIAFGGYASAARACAAGIERWPEEPSLYRDLGRAELAMEQGARFLRVWETAPAVVREDPEVQRYRAWCLAQAGREDEAVDAFRATLTEDSASRNEYARLLFQVGRRAEAERFLRDAAGTSADPVLDRIQLAQFFLAEGDRDQAREQLDAAREAAPDRPDVLVACGEYLLETPGEEFPEEEVADLIARLDASPGAAAEALYLEGRWRLRVKDFSGAVDRLGRFVRLKPESYVGHLHLATGLLANEDDAGAEAELRTALALRPQSMAVKFRLAALLYRNAAVKIGEGNPEAARESYEEILTIEPGHQPSRVFLASTLLSMGLPRVSAEHCRTMIRENPKDDVAHLLLGMTQALAGERDEALASLTKAVNFSRGHPLALLLRGLVRMDVPDPDGALMDFAAAEQRGSKDPRIPYGMAHALLLKGNREAALGIAGKLAKDAPDDPSAWQLLGEVRYACGDGAGAAKALLSAFDLAPARVEFLAAAASLLIREGVLDEAATVLARGAADEAALFFARGELARARGRTEEAETHFLHAAETQPRAHVALAELARERGELESARTGYAAAVAGGIEDPAVRFAYGTLLQDLGRPGPAREQFEAVLATHPDHLPTLNNLALSLADTKKDLARARTLAERARELAPTSPYVADTLGWVLLRSGDAAAALPRLEEAAAALPAIAEVRFHLGAAQAAAGQAEQARGSLGQALKASPRAPWAEEAARLLEELR